MITAMENIVRDAGKIAVKYHGGLKKADIHFKSEADLVTIADREVEEYISTRLKDEYPHIRFVGEESASTAEYRSGEVFVLDPIDGTTNYVHGMPYYGISLAYLKNGRPEAGVVFAPALGSLYSAQLGGGAYLNGAPIEASSTVEPMHCLAVTGFINLRARLQPDNIDTFRQVSYQVRSVLRLGSAALDLCFVADGKIDLFWEHGLNVWDVAAGALIVQEAGGKVTAMDGGSDYLSGSGGILAAGSGIHKTALSIIRDSSQGESREQD
ncbi:MAG: inositol monophosphatase family protein [Spirochaeta sp.]